MIFSRNFHEEFFGNKLSSQSPLVFARKEGSWMSCGYEKKREKKNISIKMPGTFFSGFGVGEP